jgi:hypothetical protein
MTVISSTVWDSGSTTWDSENSIWDPHRQIDGTIVPLALATFVATVTRPQIETTTETLVLNGFVSKVTRTINVSIDAVVLTLYNIDVNYGRHITVDNLPSLVITKKDTEVTLTTRNLTFFLSQII